MLDRHTAPSITNPVQADIQLPAIEHRTLMSGVPLHIYNGGAQDVFKLDINLPMGRWLQSKPLQAAFTASMLKLGTDKKSSAEIARLQDFFGSSISIGVSADTFVIGIQGLTKHMTDLIILLKEILLTPSFPQEELDNIIARSKQNYVINMTKSDFVESRNFLRALFGKSHPYGSSSTLQDYDKLTRDDIVDFYENTLSMQGGQIFLSGKFDPDNLLRVESVLNEIILNNNPTPEWTLDAPTPKNQKLEETINPKGVQMAVGVGRYLFGVHDEDQIPFTMLNTVMGGYFGSRLMSNIREDKGYTYGIYSSYVAKRHACTMHISTDVNVDVADDTLTQIRIEMDKLQQEPVPDEELLVVKNYVFSSILSSVDGPFKIMNRWKSIILNDFAEDRFRKQIEIYRALEPQDLMRLAQKYYDPETLTSVLVQ